MGKHYKSWRDYYADNDMKPPRSVTRGGGGNSAADDYYEAENDRQAEQLLGQYERYQQGHLYDIHDSKGYQTNICRHAPTLVFEWDGIKFYGCSKSKIEGAGKYGLILNCTGWKPEGGKPAVSVVGDKWKTLARERDNDADPETYVTIDWRDGEEPPVGRDWWLLALEECKKRKVTKVLVYCMGGHGRTGTALASLMTVALEIHGGKAIKAVRAYCSKAIETKAQETYVRALSLREDGTCLADDVKKKGGRK